MFTETKAEKIPTNFLNETPIVDQVEAVKKLSNHPLKNTEHFLRISGNVAWIEVDVFSREQGNHDHTNHYSIDYDLGRRLVDEAVVNESGELIRQVVVVNGS